MQNIIIKGAKENNLKNVNLKIPRNRLVCFVGVSGSGKSTIAFDIIAREGQRQYFESLNAFTRRYLAKSNKPNVDEISGLSSVIIIDQERVRDNPRSTVGTITEAYNYLRLLYSRSGFPVMDSSFFSFNHPNGACKKCKGLGRAVEVDKYKVLDFEKSLNEGAIRVNEWKVGGRQWSIIKSTKYFDMDKKIKDFNEDELNKLLYAKAEIITKFDEDFANRWTFRGVISRMFGRNTKVHRGLSEGDMKFVSLSDCDECNGWRLNKKSLEVKINDKNIGEIANMPISECINFIKSVDHKNAEVIKPRLIELLENLDKVGVGYLSLNRSTDTLSGGEAQRVKIARQMGSNLIETIYVLDEPTAGLHPRDVKNLINNLKKLKDQENTMLIVEHDEDVIRNADYLVEVGPGGGKNGGNIVFAGTPKELLDNGQTLTAKYLNRTMNISATSTRIANDHLKIRNANKNNLKNVNLDIPLGGVVALTGVSGAGKSSLVEEIIMQHPEKINLVDQSSVGNNKRGCIGTYVGMFDEIRKVFAKANNVSERLFSFNSVGGCTECKGLGFLDIDMNFLGEVKIKCEKCNGKRYKDEVLGFKYKDKNIYDVLEKTAVELVEFFDNKLIKEKVQLLIDVGLDYVELGQTLDTLSGGESQRLKLASRLCVYDKSQNIVILDEPSSGLHFADIDKLKKLLSKLLENGNSIILVEHNLDLIRFADWIIEIGPEGGEKGGHVVAEGRLVDMRNNKAATIAEYL